MRRLLLLVVLVLGSGLLLTGCLEWFAHLAKPTPPPNEPSQALIINEVEQNPPGDICAEDVKEWIELYNPTEDAVPLGGWRLATCQEESVKLDIPSTVLEPGSYLIVEVEVKKVPLGADSNSCKDWLADKDECVILLDRGDNEVDITPRLSDGENDSRSWQRCPDGQDTDSGSDWLFLPSTMGKSNKC